MKKFYLFGTLAFLLGLVFQACVDPVEQTEVGKEETVAPKTMEFHATLEEGDGTKTALDGLNVVWSEGDTIKIFSAKYPAGKNFMLKRGDGGNVSGTFVGSDLGPGPYYAVYPAFVADSFNETDGTLSGFFPQSQTYAEGSFGRGANISWGTAMTQKDLRFRNVGGAISFCLKGTATIVEVNLYTMADNGKEFLNGSMQIDSSTGNVTQGGDVRNENSRKLTLDCRAGGGVTLNEGDGVTFIVSTPAGVLGDGFFVEFVDSEGMAMVKSARGGGANVINRSMIREMPAFTYRPQFNADFLLESSDFAAYGSATTKDAVNCCLYTQGESQYAYMTYDRYDERLARFQDWNKGYSVALNILPIAMTLNGTPKVTVTALGETGPIASRYNVQMTIIKLTAYHAWLYDAKTDQGYVIKMAEED
ncbi:MAG: hypothetical protein IIT99_06445 [Bacteroidales bacterium]|nr:hypothetical protein [Bacteroidales bacterium]